MDLHLDRERAAVHRLADAIWWGHPPERLHVATLRPASAWGGWCVVLAIVGALVFALRGC